MSRTVERALKLLMTVAEPAHRTGLKELAGATDLDKATALRLLRTLQETRMVEQRADGTYALGSATLKIARAAFARSAMVGRAIPILHELAEATRETVSLSERHELANVTLYEVESTHPIRYANTIGASAPLHLGAGGRAILAFCAPDVRERVLAEPLERRTAATIATPAKLRKALADIRACGYATSYGERVAGTRSIAAPILDAAGEARGAISILWPSRSEKIDDERLRAWPKLLLAATQRLNGTFVEVAH